MRELTQIQINFLLEYFFKLEEYAGWKSIAEGLLSTGYCFVAGDSCIWKGGVGNFIETSVAENTFGCLKYEFDLEQFLSSAHYKEIRMAVFTKLAEEKEALHERLKNISELV